MLRSGCLSFQFNSRNFGLLSDCVSAARCVSKCRGHDFGSHAAVELLPGTNNILSCGVGVFSHGYTYVFLSSAAPPKKRRLKR